MSFSFMQGASRIQVRGLAGQLTFSVSELPPKQNPEFLEHSIHWIEDGCLDPKFSQGSRRGRTQVLCLLSLSGLLVLAGLAWVALTVYFETVAGETATETVRAIINRQTQIEIVTKAKTERVRGSDNDSDRDKG